MPIEIFSWNVNGVRAAARKGFLDWLEATSPDLLGLQEIKAHPEQLDQELREPEAYETTWAPAERKGYSGVALLSRFPPLKTTIGIGDPLYDREGRTIVADFGPFVLVNTYVPHGSRDHSRVDFKMEYKERLLQLCESLRASGREIVLCGDINTAHREIDLARPSQNKHTSGFLPREREWIDRFLEAGYIDTFRSLHPESAAYSWWAYWGGARSRDVGWRLDYTFISPGLEPRLLDARIHNDVTGSDHCPVSLTLDIDLADNQDPIRTIPLT
ncbi:MAG: exodeoxyribonuclease III [Anaerolineales bacterium]|jgi:exodeoxyribonuclease-3